MRADRAGAARFEPPEALSVPRPPAKSCVSSPKGTSWVLSAGITGIGQAISRPDVTLPYATRTGCERQLQQTARMFGPKHAGS